MEEKRILGLDFGSKTVGVAVSDPLGMTAQGVEIIRRQKENQLRKTLARIGELILQYQVQTIVLGFPKNMNGTQGEISRKTIACKYYEDPETGPFHDIYKRRKDGSFELIKERVPVK